MDLLVAILFAAFVQELAYTSKTVLVSHGRRSMAIGADIGAITASSIYLVLTASVTIQSGLSIATIGAFTAIVIGGAFGTWGGMLIAQRLERRFEHHMRGNEDQRSRETRPA